jgi:glycosyltransferase involved in cell wall biosynthesis
VPASLWQWNSRTVEMNGIGASEETIVFLARHWTNRAVPRPSEVFNMTPRPDTHVAVPYWPRSHLRHLHDRTDLKLIVSRSPAYGQHLDKVIGKVFPKILWLQDAHYDDLNPETASHYERIVVLTEWHRQAMVDQHGVAPNKFAVIPNFLLAEHFAGPCPERKRDHFIYASSPDRGLLKLLKLWPRILKRYPDATLDIFYGWKGCQSLAFANADWQVTFKKMRNEYETLRHQRGITERGMVNHVTIAREYQRAGLWAYPTNFHETFCSNAIKARAGGAIPVTTALAALNETAKCPEATLIDPFDPSYDERFLTACFAAIETDDDVRGRMVEAAIEEFRIERVVPLWDKLMER